MTTRTIEEEIKHQERAIMDSLVGLTNQIQGLMMLDPDAGVETVKMAKQYFDEKLNKL